MECFTIQGYFGSKVVVKGDFHPLLIVGSFFLLIKLNHGKRLTRYKCSLNILVLAQLFLSYCVVYFFLKIYDFSPTVIVL